MKIKAIPTRYNGTMFRSRLEARWAAFFDLSGLKWDYEPIDLEGWCPDFSLSLPCATVMVEVKPVNMAVHDDRFALLPDDPSFKKAVSHCRQFWVLLLGIGPQDESDFFGIGNLLDPPEDCSGWFNAHEAIRVKNAKRLWREAGNVTQWVSA